MVKSVRFKRKQIHPRRRITPKKQNTKRKKQVGGGRKTSTQKSKRTRKRTRKLKRKQKSKTQYGGQPTQLHREIKLVSNETDEVPSKHFELPDDDIDVEKFIHSDVQTNTEAEQKLLTVEQGSYLLFWDREKNDNLTLAYLKKKTQGKGDSKANVDYKELRSELAHQVEDINTFLSNKNSKNPLLSKMEPYIAEYFLKRKYPEVLALPYFSLEDVQNIFTPTTDLEGIYFLSFNCETHQLELYSGKKSRGFEVFIIKKNKMGGYFIESHSDKFVFIYQDYPNLDNPCFDNIREFISNYLKYKCTTCSQSPNITRIPHCPHHTQVNSNNLSIRLDEGDGVIIDIPIIKHFKLILPDHLPSGGDYFVYQSNPKEYRIYFRRIVSQKGINSICMLKIRFISRNKCVWSMYLCNLMTNQTLGTTLNNKRIERSSIEISDVIKFFKGEHEVGAAEKKILIKKCPGQIEIYPRVDAAPSPRAPRATPSTPSLPGLLESKYKRKLVIVKEIPNEEIYKIYSNLTNENFYIILKKDNSDYFSYVMGHKPDEAPIISTYKTLNGFLCWFIHDFTQEKLDNDEDNGKEIDL